MAGKHRNRGPLTMDRSSSRSTVMGLQRRVKFQFTDSYHSILSLTWSRFVALAFCAYILTNLVFALGYFMCGPGALGSVADDPARRFLDDFFFSVQTLSTIGYGKLVPLTLGANLLVTLESIVGLMGFAIVTGIMFSRFARPTARVLFSRVAVVNQHDGVESLIFRIANERLNQIVEARITVTMLIDEKTKEGESYRNLYDLELERQQTPIFAFSWTVVHPITPKSPLYKMTADDLLKNNVEILATVAGVDDTFSQTIHSRYSYTALDIHWNERFVDMLKRTENTFLVDIDAIHSTVPI